MAKDTRNIPSAGAAKEGLKKISQKADEAIVAQSKDASNESIQAGNAERMEGLPSSTSVPKDDTVAPDPLRKPSIELVDPTPGQDARAAARNVGTGRVDKTTVLDFGKLPSRPEGGSTPAAVNVTDKADVRTNLADRMESGMGLPGAEKGHLDRAVALHARDREIAMRTGKTVNGVQPNDPQATHITVFGGHHHRLAKVMHTFGIADEEVYKNAAAQAGQRLETYVHGLHKIAQEHEDSKRQITHTPVEGALWEHPSTKELIPVAANHPDMPMAFTRTKGKVARVTRDSQGKEIVSRSHEGWDSMKVAGGKTVYRQYTPEKGIDLVDHMRVQMLSEHGPSKTSRKKGGDIATDIANAVSGVVPRGMKQIGVQKTAVSTEEGTVEGTKPLLVPKAKKGRRAGEKPAPPKANRGEVLLGLKGPEELPTFTGKGRLATQSTLPGTGVPKTQAITLGPKKVVPAEYKRAEGPLTKWASEAVGTPVGKSTFTEDDLAPRVKIRDAIVTTEVVPTDRDWKPQDPNRGQQFAIDTTEMTGAQEVKAIASQGALASQRAAGKALVPRPGGKSKAKKDRAAAPKPMEQASLFPDFEVKEGRSNAFYMAGSTQPISEASKVLQGAADKPFGKQPNNKDFETDNEESIIDRNYKGSGEGIMRDWRKTKGKDK
jgi:hypothetical protein